MTTSIIVSLALSTVMTVVAIAVIGLSGHIIDFFTSGGNRFYYDFGRSVDGDQPPLDRGTPAHLELANFGSMIASGILCLLAGVFGIFGRGQALIVAFCGGQGRIHRAGQVSYVAVDPRR